MVVPPNDGRGRGATLASGCMGVRACAITIMLLLNFIMNNDTTLLGVARAKMWLAKAKGVGGRSKNVDWP